MPTSSPAVRISLKNILVPEDFTSASRTALPFALALARTYGSTLFFAHVIAAEPHLPVPMDPLPVACDRERSEALARLREACLKIESELVPTKTVVERGDLENVIPQVISDHEIDMVVLGTHGRRGIGKLVLGSGAEKIYRAATCPVLTIGPKAHKRDTWKIGRILLPIDLAEDPDPALRYALSLAEEHQAELILLHAVPLAPWQHRPTLEQRSCTAMNELLPDDAWDWCEPQCIVRWEHPAEAIVTAAGERECDLIVMGVHRARIARLSTHLPWPVASEVVSRAHCPVLTVRV